MSHRQLSLMSGSCVALRRTTATMSVLISLMNILHYEKRLKNFCQTILGVTMGWSHSSGYVLKYFLIGYFAFLTNILRKNIETKKKFIPGWLEKCLYWNLRGFSSKDEFRTVVVHWNNRMFYQCSILLGLLLIRQ